MFFLRYFKRRIILPTPPNTANCKLVYYPGIMVLILDGNYTMLRPHEWKLMSAEKKIRFVTYLSKAFSKSNNKDWGNYF